MEGDHSPRRAAIKSWSPGWKHKLKEVCLQRVRQDRSQLLWKIRNGSQLSSVPSCQRDEVVESTFAHIVADELNRVCQSSASVEQSLGNGERSDAEAQDTDMLWEHEPIGAHALTELANEEYQELMLDMERALYDDLQAEIRLQEDAMLEDYERTRALEDQSIVGLLKSWQEKGDGVLCPLCKAMQLQQLQTIIFCTCGHFQLDTQDDQIGLPYLQSRLAGVYEDHTELRCLGQPTFSIETRFGIPALYMSCLMCQSFEWVL